MPLLRMMHGARIVAGLLRVRMKPRYVGIGAFLDCHFIKSVNFDLSTFSVPGEGTKYVSIFSQMIFLFPTEKERSLFEFVSHKDCP